MLVPFRNKTCIVAAMTTHQLPSEFKQNILQVAGSLVPVARGCFYEVGPDLEPSGHVVLGGETRWIKPYGETYRRYDPFHPRHFAHTRRSIITAGDVHGGLHSHLIYVREFMQPIGVTHKVELLLRDSSNQIIAGLRLGRSASQGEFSADTLQRLDAFLPVIEKACVGARRPQPFPWANLTPRENEVMQCLLEAMPDKLIARELGLSLATVKLHTKSIFRKIGASSRAEAIVMAYRSGTARPTPF